MSAEIERTIPQLELRQGMSQFPTGVVGLCAVVDGEPVGMSANSFTSVSLEPPLVAVCIAKTSATWPKLERSTMLGLSVLGDQHDQVCRQLASKNGDRFAGVSWHSSDDGALYINDSALWLDCSIRDSHDAGDHFIVVFQVHDARAFPDIKPLVFHQSKFRQLVEGA